MLCWTLIQNIAWVQRIISKSEFSVRFPAITYFPTQLSRENHERTLFFFIKKKKSNSKFQAMLSSLFFHTRTTIPNSNDLQFSKLHSALTIGTSALNFEVNSQPTPPLKGHLRNRSVPRSQSSSDPQSYEEGDEETLVQDLRVPDHWLNPSKALEV